MHPTSKPPLTERQLREVEYHRERAAKFEEVFLAPLSWEMLDNPASRWWNSTWEMFAKLKQCDIQDKKVLVIGCGFGDDAMYAAKMGAKVSALDISPESLDLAKRRADANCLEIDFRLSPAETTPFQEQTFDVVIARDILHHVEIESCMREICRISKPKATFIANEIYTHSLVEGIRRSFWIDKVIYPRMRKYIYRNPLEDYTTEDEKKLSQDDLKLITAHMGANVRMDFFNFAVSRVVPKGSIFIAKVDRTILRTLGPFGRLIAGRVLLYGNLKPF